MISPAAVLLAELSQRGIQLQAHGDRLRYRPRNSVCADLAERMKTYKADLLAMLRATGPRAEAARMIRSARQAGDRDLAVTLRDAWRERVAICEIEGGLTPEEAEKVAEKNLKEVLVKW